MKDELRSYFGDALIAITEAFGETTIEVQPEQLLTVTRALKQEACFAFTFLADLSGVDCGGGQYEVVYHLLSLTHKRRLRLKIKLSDGERVASVVGIWPTANWHERECYDMFGISFAGHPDLTRILTPEGFAGHPLRKTYPLRGEP